MLKNFGIALLALLAFGLCVTVGDMVSHGFYPPPAAMDATNMDSIREHMASMPIGAYLIMMAGHLAGAVLAGWLVGRFSGNTTVGLVVGALMTMGGVMNLAMLPHPVWFWADALIYPAGAWFGFRMGKR